MSVVIFVLILSFLVVIHELGHFLAAKVFGVRVEEFGMGYPPKAKSLGRKWGTEFTLNWIPFGGFVRMEGEDASDPAAQSSTTSLLSKPGWQQLIVILAGALVNFAFGVVAFAVVFSIIGIPTPLKTARIGLVQDGSPAAQAGLPTKVEIIKLSRASDEVTGPTTDQAIAFIMAHRGQTIDVTTTGPCTQQTCQELAQQFQVYVRTGDETPSGQGPMGIAFEASSLVFYPWYEMPFRGSWYGMKQALGLGVEILQSLRAAVVQGVTRGQIPAELSGPVGIVHQAQVNQVFQQGWLNLLGFAGMLSINLAIMNVLPIPALDGGRAVFILIAPLVGKRRLALWEGRIHYGGFVVLIGLIVAITARDIVRIIYGS